MFKKNTQQAVALILARNGRKSKNGYIERVVESGGNSKASAERKREGGRERSYYREQIARQHKAPAGVETRVSVAWSRMHNLSHMGASMVKVSS